MTVELLTPADAARITGLSIWTIRDAVRDGELAASKLRGRIRIHPDALADWVDVNRVQPPAPVSIDRVPAPRPRPSAPSGSARDAVRARRRAA